MDTEENLLTSDEFCELIDVHANTLGRWRRAGMPYFVRGRSYLYSWEQVYAWMMDTGKRGYLRAIGAA